MNECLLLNGAVHRIVALEIQKNRKINKLGALRERLVVKFRQVGTYRKYSILKGKEEKKGIFRGKMKHKEKYRNEREIRIQNILRSHNLHPHTIKHLPIK